MRKEVEARMRTENPDAFRRSTVLVADGHPLTRDGVRALLSAEPDLAVCGEADTAADVRRLADALRPDLVVLDPGLSGDDLGLVAELRSRPSPPKVVVLAGDNGPGDAAERALRLGAAAFVSKRAGGDELLRAVRDALDGRTVLSDALIERLIRQRSGGGQRPRGGVTRRSVAR